MSSRAPRAPRGEGPAGAWDPLRDLMSLKDRLNRLFENVLRRGDFAEGDVAGWSPSVDLRENEEGFVLTAELPGVRREDIQIRVERGILTLEGRRPMETEAREAEHLRLERSYGPFTRTFHLPAPIDESGVTAQFRHGVLELFAPKSTESGSRPVKVKVG
jgi:HSP20 family protein